MEQDAHHQDRYANQAAGHSDIRALPDGFIAKKVAIKEARCYEKIEKTNSPLRDYCAPYHGLYSVDSISEIEEAEQVTSSLISSAPSIADPSGRCIYAGEKQTSVGYIVMDDLMKDYNNPCILDLKLGTRTYWDGAPPSKIERHNNMCKKTTNGSLGMRICGMKVFHPETNTTFTLDKEWGKTRTVDSTLASLAVFFFNGQEFRTDIIDGLIEKIEKLREIVRDCTWRFWSSSLLISYEGSGKKADVHLIDFGNCNFSGSYTTADDGCILALSNIIAYFRLIQNGAFSASEVKKIIEQQ